MSRIGKKQIDIPEGIKIDIDGQKVKVSGPKGQLEREIHREIGIEIKEIDGAKVSARISAASHKDGVGRRDGIIQIADGPSLIAGAKERFRQDAGTVKAGDFRI